MADRIQVVIAVPVDDALPIDVQGVGLRRRAIELMQEVAKISESTVRYQGATDQGPINFGAEVGVVSLWQRNLIAARFIADGEANKQICGPVVHEDRTTRVYSVASVVRDEFS